MRAVLIHSVDRACRWFLVALVAVLALMVTGRGSWQLSSAPYGGCAEAWQAPQSDGADWCRGHGWTVTARLVVSPHAVVKFSSLPHCHYEDGSGGPRPCTWNVGTETDGNGAGLAYVIRRDMSARFVWAVSPLRNHPGRAWVTPELARKSGTSVRCWVNVGPTTVIACPNGRRITS